MRRIDDDTEFRDLVFPHDDFREDLDLFGADLDQLEMANEIARFCDSPRKGIHFLKASTGIGKTDMTILGGLRSNTTSRIFYTAGTRYLQRQGFDVSKSYKSLNSFVDCLRIKGRSNYQCLKYDSRNAAQCVANRFRHCEFKPNIVDNVPKNRDYIKTRRGTIKSLPSEMCEYYHRKSEAIPVKESGDNKRVLVMTTQYLITEALYAGELQPCDLLIVDEAGNLEQEIISCTSIDIDEDYLNYIFGRSYTIDVNADNVEEVRDWLNILYNDVDVRVDELKERIERLDADVSNRPSSSVEGERYSMERRLVNCVRLIEKIELIADRWNPDKLAIDVTSQRSSRGSGSVRKLRVRFTDVKEEFQDLFGGIVNDGGAALLMSATLPPLDYLLDVFGVEDRNYRYDIVKSNWPKSNRPVVVVKGMKMNARVIDKLKYDMFNYVEDMVDYVTGEINENMILHTHTHSLKKFFADGLDPDAEKGLVISHDMNGHDRSGEKAINMFRESEGGKVLVSPSAYEGVDFPGDICKFQVNVKVPFPDMSDKWVKRKMEKHDDFLLIHAQRSLEQMIGRIIRSENDRGLTMIMDSSIIALLAQIELESEHWSNLIGFKKNETIRPKDTRMVVEDFFNGSDLDRWKSYGYGIQRVHAEKKKKNMDKLGQTLDM